MAPLGGDAIPIRGLPEIQRNTFAIFIQFAKNIRGSGIAGLRCPEIPLRCLGKIFGEPGNASLISPCKSHLRVDGTLFGGCPIPSHGFGPVLLERAEIRKPFQTRTVTAGLGPLNERPDLGASFSPRLAGSEYQEQRERKYSTHQPIWTDNTSGPGPRQAADADSFSNRGNGTLGCSPAFAARIRAVRTVNNPTPALLLPVIAWLQFPILWRVI